MYKVRVTAYYFKTARELTNEEQIQEIEEKLSVGEKWGRQQITDQEKWHYEDISNYYNKINNIICDKNRLLSINFMDSMGFDVERDEVYYRFSKDEYMSYVVYRNVEMKKYYKYLYEKHRIMTGKAYAINKYERPLFKIGIPYDVVRVILSYILKL